MIQKKRINNDVFVRWGVFTPEGLPVDLTEVTSITIEARPQSSNGRYPMVSKVVDNFVEAYFLAKDQKVVGKYNLYLTYTIDDPNIIGDVATYTIDYCDAFELLPKSCFVDGEDDIDPVNIQGIIASFTYSMLTEEEKNDLASRLSDNSGAQNLSDLLDVTISNLEIDQILKYDGTKWVNATPTGSSSSNVSWGIPTSQYTPLTVNGVTRNISLNTHTHHWDTITNRPLTDEQFQDLLEIANLWKLDNDGNLYTERNVYSHGEVSAYNWGESPTPPVGVYNLKDLLDVGIIDPQENNILRFNGSHWVNVPSSNVGTLVEWSSETDNYINLLVGDSSKSISLHGHKHEIGDINNLQDFLNFKQDNIPLGDISQYYRGDKEWATLNTDTVVEATNLYYTPERVIGLTGGLYAQKDHTHDFNSLTGLPNTLDGYGIIDAYNKTEIDNLLSSTSGFWVKSVGLEAPTGFTVSNSPIIYEGNIKLSFASGYSLPSNSKQYNWDLAFFDRHTHTNINVLNELTIDDVTNWNSIQEHLNDYNNPHQVSFKQLINKPSTLLGYGITDVYSKTEVDYIFSNITPGESTIKNVYGYDSINQSFSDDTLSDTFNAYTISRLHGRLTILEQGDTNQWDPILDTIINWYNNIGRYWLFDANNDALYTNKNVYSTQEISAYGYGGSGGGSGGAGALSELSDTSVDSRVTGDILIYNGTHWENRPQSSIVPDLSGYIPVSQKGSPNGVAELDATGHIPASQLPSYVDDVLEFSNQASFPLTGETGKIYVALDSNLTYRWSGSGYVEISPSLALGETSSTAYRGDRGKIAYDHSQVTGNPHNTTFAQLGSKPTTLSGFGITDAVTSTVFNNHKNNINDEKHLTQTQLTGLINLINWWKLDGSGNLYTDLNVYSTKEVSAYGLGTGGGGGSSSFAELVDVDITGLETTNLITYNGTHWVPIPRSSVGTIVNWGTTSNSTSPLTVGTTTKTVSLSGHTHAMGEITGLDTALSGKQPLNASLTSISGLSGTTGLLRKTAANTYTLDTSAYITGNQNITLSGDVTGSGTTAITTSIAASVITGKALTGYSVGTNAALSTTDTILSAFGKVQAQINARPGTVTSIGLTAPTGFSVTGSPITSAGTLTLAFASGYSLPTTAKQNNWDTVYNWYNTVGKYWLYNSANDALYTEKNVYSTKEVSAYGAGTSGGGSGIIETVYGYSSLGGTFSNTNLTDTFNAYTTNQLYNRIVSLESGAALTITTTGSGNAITSVTKSGSVLTFTKGSTFSLSGHTHAISDITGLQSALDSKYAAPAGTTAQYIRGDGSLATFPTLISQTELDTGTANTARLISALRLNTWLTNKNLQSFITAGTTSQYYRGDKTWQTLNTTAVTEGTNLYYTNARVKSYADTLYAPISHTHPFTEITGVATAAQIPNLDAAKITTGVFGIARIPTGTTSTTVALGNHTHTFASLTSKPTTLSGYGITDAVTLTSYNNHANNLVSNQKHLTDAQLSYLVNLISWWKLDSSNNLYTDLNLYSTKEVSAYGIGSGGSGGGGLIETVYGYASLGGTFNNSILTDTFNAYTINQLHSRINSLEAGSALTINTTGSGNAVTAITKSGTALTVTKGLNFSQVGHTHLWADITDKPSTFTPSAHTHSTSDITSGTFNIARIPTGTSSSTVALGNHLHTGVYEPTFTKNTAFNKNFGTASGTVAQGNDSRIINGQTAYSWGNHASAGYVPSTRTITAGNGLTGGGTLAADRTLTLGTPSDITATSTNSVTSTSHTHSLSMGSGSGLDADLLDGKHGSDYRGAITLPFIYDYDQIVIGLVNLDNSNINRESWSSGQIYVNRPNGVSWMGGVINYSVQKRYNASTMWGYIDSTQSGIQLCTFTYNGVKYGGIRYYPVASQVSGGTKLYGRWSDTTPFVVRYRNNSGVLNSEVNGSIVINGSDVFEQRLRTSDNIYAFTSDNVASATKLQTPRTIWGQSFDGTGNVTGNMTGVGSITSSYWLLNNSSTNPYLRLTRDSANYYLQLSGSGLHLGPTGPLSLIINQEGKIAVPSTIEPYSTNNRSAGMYGVYDSTRAAHIWSLGRDYRIADDGLSFGSLYGLAYKYANTITNSRIGTTHMIVGVANGTIGFELGLNNGSAYFAGSIGVGIAPTQKLHVAGNILATGEITAYVASDKRLKELIKPIQSPLDRIMELNPVSYKWNEEAFKYNSGKTKGLDYGLIAQDVENIIPEVVHGIYEDKYKSIDYIKLIPFLIGAIKELKTKLDKYEKNNNLAG